MEEKKPGGKRALSVLLAVLLVAAAGFAVYVNRNTAFISSALQLFVPGAKTDLSLGLEEADEYSYAKLDDQIVIARPDGVAAYDRALEEQWSIAISGDAPTVKTSGRYALVFYANSTQAVLANGKNNVPIATEYNIIGGSVNDDGYFALVTEEQGFKSQVIVYAPDGTVQYKWHSADQYVVGAEVSPKNNAMVVSTLNFDEGAAAGSLVFFDFSKTEPVRTFDFTGNLVLDLKYYDQNNIVAVGDQALSAFHADGYRQWEVKYDAKTLFTYNTDGDNIVLALGNTGASTDKTAVQVYTPDGKLKGEFTNNGEVVGLDVNKNRILVAGTRDLKTISESGKQQRSFNVGKEIKRAFLFDNSKTAFAVTSSMAQIVQLD